MTTPGVPWETMVNRLAQPTGSGSSSSSTTSSSTSPSSSSSSSSSPASSADGPVAGRADVTAQHWILSWDGKSSDNHFDIAIPYTVGDLSYYMGCSVGEDASWVASDNAKTSDVGNPDGAWHNFNVGAWDVLLAVLSNQPTAVTWLPSFSDAAAMLDDMAGWCSGWIAVFTERAGELDADVSQWQGEAAAAMKEMVLALAHQMQWLVNQVRGTNPTESGHSFPVVLNGLHDTLHDQVQALMNAYLAWGASSLASPGGAMLAVMTDVQQALSGAPVDSSGTPTISPDRLGGAVTPLGGTVAVTDQALWSWIEGEAKARWTTNVEQLLDPAASTADSTLQTAYQQAELVFNLGATPPPFPLPPPSGDADPTDPGSSTPGVADPSTTDPGLTDPGGADPGTADTGPVTSNLPNTDLATNPDTTSTGPLTTSTGPLTTNTDDPDTTATTTGDDSVLGPDGNPLTGSDGAPLTVPTGSTIGPDGTVYGPDGLPLTGTNGNPVTVPTGSTLTPQTGVYGPDGKPVLGTDGKPVSVPQGSTVNADGTVTGPNGKPLLGANGKPLTVPKGSRIGAADGTGGTSGKTAGSTDTTPAALDTVTVPKGSVIDADGTVKMPNGKLLTDEYGNTVTVPKGTTIGTDGTLMGSNGKPLGYESVGRRYELTGPAASTTKTSVGAPPEEEYDAAPTRVGGGSATTVSTGPLVRSRAGSTPADAATAEDEDSLAADEDRYATTTGPGKSTATESSAALEEEEENAARSSSGSGYMPPMGGMGGGAGAGQQGGGERKRAAWVTEDADTWGFDPDDVPPGVIGR